MGIIKLAVKVGLAAGAVYYIKDQGVWKESEETQKTCQELKSTINPYIRDLKAQIPIELPEIPETENLLQSTKQYWNKGVQSAFEHLTKSPEYISEWTKKGYESVMQNKEISNLVGSLNNKSQVEK
ncbi:MICOS complex subunit MIC13 homolog QIL1 isoform X2 [Aethina tumida]|uniref:MICOS complex subunit MIC13 homolog QIL1 isoform X2 n=1 Tax=Aethina tumida TaxID=116153 RepID=UPI00096AF7AD|nr:MICOS complex subunit MIC13 homolog QIL1 isoform X2 [Aethina tumida]